MRVEPSQANSSDTSILIKALVEYAIDLNKHDDRTNLSKVLTLLKELVHN